MFGRSGCVLYLETFEFLLLDKDSIGISKNQFFNTEQTNTTAKHGTIMINVLTVTRLSIPVRVCGHSAAPALQSR